MRTFLRVLLFKVALKYVLYPLYWLVLLILGPENANATYAATPSGWFDGNQFELWFENNFLPFIEARHPDRGNKPIVLLGDNLASHYSPHVIETAADLNIYFACFPANATHLLQPLDVGFFKPFKQLWRKILDDWKVTTRAVGAVPKEYFPSLLKHLWDQVERKKEATLQASFRTTGLYPFDNPSKVLDKLPGGERQADDGDPLNDSLVELLSEKRGWTAERKRKRDRKISAGNNNAAQRSNSTSG